MSITEEQVWERLRTVIDPELKINIVDLGLVYKIQVTSDKRQEIRILMTLTTPGCPLAGMFEVLIKHKVKGDVEIELTFDPPWTADMMSAAAKAELGFS